ncbi:hypothetical protein ACHWQZ_G011936 [Mnemiopsis leidyi]
MELSQLKKGALSKLFTLISFGLLATSVIVFVLPVVSENAGFDGVCNVSKLYWLDDTCVRGSNFYFTYSVPVVEGYAVKLGGRPTILPGDQFHSTNNLTVVKYSALFVSKSRQRIGNSSTTAGLKYRSIIFDDYSDNPLVNCSTNNTVALKQVLVEYIPFLREALDVNSTVDHTLKYHPDYYFNCSFMPTQTSNASAFIDYQWTEKWLTATMPLAISMVIGGLVLVDVYDRDGSPKELANFLLMWIFFAFCLLNIPFFLIIRVLIWGCLLGNEPGELIDFIKAGSIFFPLVWLFKTYCVKRSTSASPPPAPRARPQTSPAGTSAATLHSRPGRSSVSPADSPLSENHIPRSRSLSRESVPETFPPAPPNPSSRPHAPPISSEEPPSYPAIYTEGTVLHNQVVLQYHRGLDDSEVLPPPPSYDDAVKNG